MQKQNVIYVYNMAVRSMLVRVLQARMLGACLELHISDLTLGLKFGFKIRM